MTNTINIAKSAGKSGNCPACKVQGVNAVGTHPVELNGEFVYFCAEHAQNGISEIHDYLAWAHDLQ